MTVPIYQKLNKYFIILSKKKFTLIHVISNLPDARFHLPFFTKFNLSSSFQVYLILLTSLPEMALKRLFLDNKGIIFSFTVKYSDLRPFLSSQTDTICPETIKLRLFFDSEKKLAVFIYTTGSQ